MIPITIALIVVQEMCGRMGVVTGKGLSDLIREEFGLRLTFVLMVLLVVVNYTNVVTEFIGIAGSMHLFHVAKWISVPICALLVWALVLKGDYKSTEKIFLIAALVYIAYIFTGVLAQPNWHEALLATVRPPADTPWRDKSYIYMAVGVVGTTIAPWMQFYLQSSVVEKGIGVKDYGASRLDVIVGCFFTDLIAWFIVVACAATLYVHGMGAIQVASDAAEAMRPLAGDYAFLLFAFGLFNLVVRGVDSAAFDRVHGVRGHGVRVGGGQELPRGAALLLAVHGADRGRSHHGDAAAGLAACERGHPVAGAERRTAAGHHHPDAVADQPQGPDGRVQELAAVERGGVVDERDRDRHDDRHAVGDDSRALSRRGGRGRGIARFPALCSAWLRRREERSRRQCRCCPARCGCAWR
jgi:hypothetical protein